LGKRKKENHVQFSGPNRYSVKIDQGRCYCVEANGQPAGGFILPDVAGSLSKLYVVKQAEDVLYVGITRQDIRTRLRYGFKAKGENGYHGYKWKDLDRVEMLIWSFPDSRNDDVEAIEAEVVFLVRQKTGRWPKYQMEIHFHHGATEVEEDIAQSVLAECLG